MWKRRDPSQPEPVEEQERAPDPGSSGSSAPTRPTEAVGDEVSMSGPASTSEDDPYAQLENFFNQPLVLEDLPSPSSQQPDPAPPRASAPAGWDETVQRLEQFGLRLAARFEALEAHVQQGSAQTLEAVRRMGERLGAELAMLDKRAVNLELTMARLRAATEALELSLRKLPHVSREHEGASLASSAELPTPPEPASDPMDLSAVTVTDGLAEDPSGDATSRPPADALFTLEDEVPPSDWDEPPPDELGSQ